MCTEVVIGWEVEVYTVTEGTDATVELCAIIREGELTFELPAINIGTEDGSAVSGSDYSGPANPSSFVFSDSASSRQCTMVTIEDDVFYEDLVENFFVTLTETSSTPRVTVQPDRAQVDIVDTDSKLA